MFKENVIKAAFHQKPSVAVRVIMSEDNNDLKQEKKKFPFLLENPVIVTIQTNYREFSFKIKQGYVWNGADIPKFLWRVVGSKMDNDFLTASLVHDYMLEFRKYILSETLCNQMSIKEYRRLSSLVFRQILRDSGVFVLKASVMSWCVDFYQTFFNKKNWRKGNF